MSIKKSGMAKIATVGVALFALAGCASTPNTFANADPTVDFTQYQSFGFVPQLDTDSKDYQSLETNFLKVAVAQEFDRRGMTHDHDNPQLLVNFIIHTQEKLRSRAVPTATVGVGYGWYDPWYDTWGGYGGYRTEISQITEGTLSIDVVDAASKKLIWEGQIKGRVTDKAIKNLEATIDEAVKAIMEGYPIAPAGA